MKKSLLLIGLSIFAIYGCGDSSSSVSNIEHITKGELAEITETNKNSALAVAVGSFAVDEDINSLQSNRVTNKENSNNLSLRKNAKLVANYRVESQECDSGNIEVDDENLIVRYNNCLINGTTINGEIKYYSTPSEENVDALATGLRISNSSNEIYYESLRLNKDGDKEDIKATGYIKANNDTSKFVDLHLNTNGDKKSIDGSISSSNCLDGKWIDIKTKKAMVDAKGYVDCPDKGDVVLSGKNNTSVEIVFNADYNSSSKVYNYQEYNVTFNGDTQIYDSCDELENDLKNSGCMGD